MDDWYDYDLRPSGTKVKIFKALKWLLISVSILLIPLTYVVAKNGCVDEDRSHGVLESAGYKDIEFKDGYQWWTCGDDDRYATGFIATNPRGKRVEGTVCCGLIKKACTIRF